jgi:hypothetical protein
MYQARKKLGTYCVTELKFLKRPVHLGYKRLGYYKQTFQKEIKTVVPDIKKRSISGKFQK